MHAFSYACLCMTICEVMQDRWYFSAVEKTKKIRTRESSKVNKIEENRFYFTSEYSNFLILLLNFCSNLKFINLGLNFTFYRLTAYSRVFIKIKNIYIFFLFHS